MAWQAVAWRRGTTVTALFLLFGCRGGGPSSDAALGGAVTVRRDLAYGQASPNQRLDFYVPRQAPVPPPLVVLVHGGGWMTLTKDDVQLSVSAYLAAGWAVANVEYRLGFEAPAPAAARDVRCAIKWAASRAGGYGVDPSRLVVAGESADAHLVMLAAFADSSAGLDEECPGAMPSITGVVNWAGITDVGDLLAGPNARGWAVGWIGQAAGAAERARRLSPLGYVRPGLPPVLTIHGDRDDTVPFAHAERLKVALDAAGVPNEQVVLRGARHGPYDSAESATAWSAITRFLAARASAGR